MAEQGLVRTQNRNIKNGEDVSVKDSLAIEILKEGEECPNCHFALLRKKDDEIFCPVCGYGRKPCT